LKRLKKFKSIEILNVLAVMLNCGSNDITGATDNIYGGSVEERKLAVADKSANKKNNAKTTQVSGDTEDQARIITDHDNDLMLAVHP
jgi:hypothetical protein